MASKMNLPYYMILPQKTIATLANYLPQTPTALNAIKGMGKKKANLFGPELLEMINAYCKEMSIEPKPETFQVVKTPAKVKTDTKLTSLNLFKAGKSISQIAEERTMAVTTIEGHLAHFIGTGELSVNEFISPDITALIANHFEGQGDYHLGPVKAALGDQVSWSEIRFVLKHLEYLGKMKSNG
jgi:ribonuclease D